jgi:membrane protein implicated in regulation of membrane protease activity
MTAVGLGSGLAPVDRIMNLAGLSSWHQLIFVVPFLLAMAYLGVYVVSGWTFGDGDADGGADADADGDAGADAHVDADLDGDGIPDAADGVDADVDHDLTVEHDASAHLEHDADADRDAPSHAHHGAKAAHAAASGKSLGGALLAFLGLGKVPLSLVLMVLCFLFGFIGFFANQALADVLPGEQVALASVPMAAVGAYLLTGSFSSVMAKLLPNEETSAVRRQQLLGLYGTAVFRVDDASGMVMLRDTTGTRIQVGARTKPGAPPIDRDREVILASYDREHSFYYVVPAPVGSEVRSVG